MAEPMSSKSPKEADEHSRLRAQRARRSQSQETASLEQTVGNRTLSQLLRTSLGNLFRRRSENRSENPLAAEAAPQQPAPASVAQLLDRAGAEPGKSLDDRVRRPLERQLGANLDHVRVHSGSASEAAAQSIDARAYTIGADIHLGLEGHCLTGRERDRLLAHEAVHTVQQGGQRVPLQGKLQVNQPGDRAEGEAKRIANMVAVERPTASGSSALALRGALRASPVVPGIQRDIVGSQKWPQGEFEIDFKKTDGKAAGDTASEDGCVTFRPSSTAPESNSIKFIQIVRTFDTSTGKDLDWTGSPEANRNKMQTSRNNAKNIAPGFYVDQVAALLSKRTKKADPAVSAFYMDTPPLLAGNKAGKRKGKTTAPAVLVDTPGSAGAVRFNFVTSAKAADTGTWYGTVLWGFETFLDKAGVTKIRNEYRSFRVWQGETTDEAIKQFGEFYQNPGASTAPTK